jgi:hypothetical protein
MDPHLLEVLSSERRRTFDGSTDQQYIVPILREGRAYPYHPLIIGKFIGDGEYHPFSSCSGFYLINC